MLSIVSPEPQLRFITCDEYAAAREPRPLGEDEGHRTRDSLFQYRAVEFIRALEKTFRDSEAPLPAPLELLEELQAFSRAVRYPSVRDTDLIKFVDLYPALEALGRRFILCMGESAPERAELERRLAHLVGHHSLITPLALEVQSHFEATQRAARRATASQDMNDYNLLPLAAARDDLFARPRFEAGGRYGELYSAVTQGPRFIAATGGAPHGEGYQEEMREADARLATVLLLAEADEGAWLRSAHV